MNMFSKILKFLKFIKLKYKQKYVNKCRINSIDVSDDIIVGEYVQIPKKCHIRNNVKIGKATYLSPNTIIESNVEIGKFCSLAPNVFIAPGEHYCDYVTTHPLLFDPIWRNRLGIKEEPGFTKTINKIDKKTIIGNDVWIGLNAIIMRGVNVGDGAIIGAGSVVTRDVPPYAIVAGVPAKVLRFRFSKSRIEFLLRNKWWNKDINIKEMYNIDVYGEKYEN